MIVIIPPDGNKLFGTILVIVGLVTYVIGKSFVNTPKEFTCNGYVPIVNDGKIVVILVWENDAIWNGNVSIVINKGFWAVL